MIVIRNNNKEIKRVPINSIIYLTKQLDMFVTRYEKYIPITDEETFLKLGTLKQIVAKLKAFDYNSLINMPELVIDFTITNDYLPDWFPL